MADRTQLLEEIQQVGFQVDDLTLYLDTHPLDRDALDAFTQAKNQRYQLMQNYAREFEPLNIYLVCPDTNNETGTYCKYPGEKLFPWSDGPLPWYIGGGLYYVDILKTTAISRKYQKNLSQNRFPDHQSIRRPGRRIGSFHALSFPALHHAM